MSYPYPVSGNIPQPGDDPSISQGELLTNFANLVGWSTEDHIEYGATNAGQHSQVRFPSNATVSTPAGLAATQSTIPGVADNTTSQAILTTPSAAFPMSAIRAFGTCKGDGSGSVALANGYNISSITFNSLQFTITMPAGAVSGTNYAVFVGGTVAAFSSFVTVWNYAVVSATQFTIVPYALNGNFAGSVPPRSNINNISFVVLQM